jgi:uncharacterized spore protein YtfJ
MQGGSYKEGYMDANQIVETIAERVKDAATIDVVFGDPVEAGDGLTIIPVASVKVAGGGGGGSGAGKRTPEGEEGQRTGNDRGMGLGVKVSATPLGYIEVKEGNARFVQITDTTKVALAGMMVFGVLLLTFNRMMRFRSWKMRKAAWKMHKQQMA